MSASFDEGKLRFCFDDSWRVEKYDDHCDYRKGLARLSGSKAVDFVGLDGSGDCCFIEVKDFRGRRIENKERFGGPLAEEVAQKVRDSIAGIIGAHRRSSIPETWAAFANALADPQRDVRVVLWVEDDVARNPRQWRAKASVLTNRIKQRMFWLTGKVLVVNQRTHGGVRSDLTVSNLPGAGHN